MHHESSKPPFSLASPPGGIGAPNSPFDPLPFTPTPPHAHGFPIDVASVLIGRWAEGKSVVPYLWSLTATRQGPHVALVAPTRGDATCGSFTLHLLLRGRIRPLHGRLSLLFANWQAHERWDHNEPNRAFFIAHHMNRVWSEALPGSDSDGVKLRRARALRGYIVAIDPRLDLHSPQQPPPPLLLPGDQPRKVALAVALGRSTLVVEDVSGSAPGPLRDFGALGGATEPRTTWWSNAASTGCRKAAGTPRSADAASRTCG